MVISTEQVAIPLTLYRGDSAASAVLAKAHGIEARRRWLSGGFPDHDYSRLVSNLPYSIIGEIDVVASHVLAVWETSPLIALTLMKAKAHDYARRYGHNPSGTIFKICVILSTAWSWEPLPGEHSRIYGDSLGRVLIHVSELHLLDSFLPDNDVREVDDDFDEPVYRKPKEREAVFGRDHAGVVRLRSARDDEWLVLGDIHRDELSWEDVGAVLCNHL